MNISKLAIIAIIVFSSLLTLPRAGAAEALEEIQEKNVTRWRELLDQARQSSDTEKINLLWAAPRSLGIWIESGRSSKTNQKLYDEITTEISSISNYMDYFTNEIERKRKETEHLPFGVGERSSLPGLRAQYIRDTLPHLPAPQTIAALGNYLYDDRDIPPPPRPYQDAGDIPANSVLASNALTRIGLIDPPRHNLKAQKKWWEQVKAGKRWFAFHGQPVSYRFRPDGTVETKPRDASKDKQWIVGVQSFDFIPEPDIPVSRYWWTGGGVFVLLLSGGAVYLTRRRKLREASA